MEASEFDRLSRAVGGGGSRRRILGLLTGLPIAGLLGGSDLAEAQHSRRAHRRHPQQQRHQAKTGERQNQRDDTHSEACIPTGQACPSKKARGKKKKKLGCAQCCQGSFITEASGKTVCGCQPNGGACTPNTASSCCSGYCDGTTCHIPPSAPCDRTCGGCCANGQCQPGTSVAVCGSGGRPCTACAGTTPLCQHGDCVACTSTSQCPTSTVCAPSGACQPCTVSGNGSDLANAVAAAGAGDILYVCAGTYDGGFTIASTITIIGAGADVDGTIIQGGNPVVVVDAGTAAQPATLERLRIQDGRGGMVLNTGRALTMRDSTVRGNSGPGPGGIFNNGGTLVLERCVIENNVAGSGTGAGLFNIGGPATLTDCLIRGNSAKFVGGIENDNVMVLSGTHVTENIAAIGDVSGVYNDGGTVTLQNGSTVCGNLPSTMEQCFQVTGPGCSTTCPPS